MTTTVKSSAWKSAVKFASVFASRSEARPHLFGIFVAPSPEGCWLIASDSYRCGWTWCGDGPPAEMPDPTEGVVVPTKLLTRAAAMMPADRRTDPEATIEIVDLDAGMRAVKLVCDGLALQLPANSEAFPDYRKVMPDLNDRSTIGTGRFGVNAEFLSEVVKAFGASRKKWGDAIVVRVPLEPTKPIVFHRQANPTAWAMLMPVRL